MKRYVLLFLLLIFINNSNARVSEGFAVDSTNSPNIVFILVDDLGWADVGAYGNTYHDTPNIDKLSEQGIRFTDAYATPVCAPSRVSIQTGLYPARIGRSLHINPHRRPWAKLKLPQNFWHQLPRNHSTLAEVLKKEGYTSTLIGKWGLGYDSPGLPKDRGYVEPPSIEHSSLNQTYRDQIVSFAAENPYKEIGPQTLQAAKFIQNNKNRPFMCFLSYNSVHVKMEARQELIHKYKTKSQQVNTDYHPKYSAMVETVDESVGLLMNVLDQLDLTNNTVVMFFSDNGGLIQVYHQNGPIVGINSPLRAEKGTLYEGGIRVPLIIRWPNRIKAGRIDNTPVISNDFFPTIAKLAGAKTEKAVSEDAESLLPILLKEESIDRNSLYWHYPSYHHSTPAAAIRVGQYKLIEFYETGSLELYDLGNDIGELNNLAKKMPMKAKELQIMLHNWQQKLQADMPTLNSDYNPSKAYIWGVRPKFSWQKAPLKALPVEEKNKLID